MDVAWIGFAGGLIAAALSAFVALRQSRLAERLTRLDHDLDEEVNRRSKRFERELAAEDVLARYRLPLASAAFDLQSRLYNILRLDFLGKFGGDHARAEEALTTTLFRLSQYFGWTEILRRDVQFLSFPQDAETRRVADLQARIARALLTDAHGPEMMIWTEEQRAIGEMMIVEKPDKLLCMGYATFSAQRKDRFGPWLARLRAELDQAPGRARLLDVQHLLCDLVDALDPDQVRYSPESRKRA